MRLQRFLLSGTGELAYRYRPGAGPPLVIVHGLAGSSIEEYAPLFDDPRWATRGLLAVDLFGFGHSSAPDDFSYQLDAHADAVSSLCAALGLGPVAWLGHSLGGSIGVVFAERHPDQLAALALAEGAMEATYLTVARWAARYPDEASFVPQFDFLLSSAGEGMGAFLARPTLKMTTPSAFYRSSRDLIAHTRGTSFVERFFSLRVPTEYWIGERSLRRWGDAFRAELARRGSRWRLLPEAGHQLMLDNPAAFQDAVASWLAEV